MNVLNIDDLNLILEALNYTKAKFEAYDAYPSYELKIKQIEKVDLVILKVREMYIALQSKGRF